ncbi:MAG: hypothetical protein JO148_10590 [Acidimicrobiia bacterium]|nr:hypothetical protein [Acidimicrobiia bacterium]
MAPSIVTVEIDPHSDPISGRVVNEGRTRSFCGWLEFAAALHAAFENAESAEVSAV